MTKTTGAEIARRNYQAEITSALTEARQAQGISRRRLAELSGVSQPVITRIESGSTTTRIDSLLKVLAALGLTLAIVPLPIADDQ